MSKQEIIGEINMNHKQKGGLEAEKIAAISVSAVVLLFCFIYYIYKSAKISPKNTKCTISQLLEKEIKTDIKNEDNEDYKESIHGIIIIFLIKTAIENKSDDKIQEELIETLYFSLKKEILENQDENQDENKLSFEHKWNDFVPRQTKIIKGLFIDPSNNIVNFLEEFKIIKMLEKIIKKLDKLIENLNGDLVIKQLIEKLYNDDETRKDAVQQFLQDDNLINNKDMLALIFHEKNKVGKMLSYTKYINPVWWTLYFANNRTQAALKKKMFHTADNLKAMKLGPLYSALNALILDIIQPIKDKLKILKQKINLESSLDTEPIVNKILELNKDKKDIKYKQIIDKMKNIFISENSDRECYMTVKALTNLQSVSSTDIKPKIGGALIGQGTFGCVFKPHLLCNSGDKQYMDNKHVSKLIVLHDDEKYRLKNEIDIGKTVNGSAFKDNFSAIIKVCDIDYNKIKDNEISNCNSYNKYPNNKLALATLRYVDGINFTDTIKKSNNRDAFIKFFAIYEELLGSLKILSNEKIIHYDIKWDNVLYDKVNKKSVIIDFGLSFKIDYIDFNSIEGLKKYFYGYWEKHNLWSFEIQYINFLLHKKDSTFVFIEDFVTNSLFFKVLNFDYKKLFIYCYKIVKKFEKLSDNILVRIKEITQKYHKTWDNYSLSTMYLKHISLVSKNLSKNKTVNNAFIKKILIKNIDPNPNVRLSLNKTLTMFKKLKLQIKAV